MQIYWRGILRLCQTNFNTINRSVDALPIKLYFVYRKLVNLNSLEGTSSKKYSVLIRKSVSNNTHLKAKYLKALYFYTLYLTISNEQKQIISEKEIYSENHRCIVLVLKFQRKYPLCRSVLNSLQFE